MKILQVKKFNSTIAQWQWQNCDKTKCVPSMFYFYLDNEYTRRNGFNIERKKGYVAFGEHRYCFGMNEQKAIEQFKNY